MKTSRTASLSVWITTLHWEMNLSKSPFAFKDDSFPSANIHFFNQSRLKFFGNEIQFVPAIINQNCSDSSGKSICHWFKWSIWENVDTSVGCTQHFTRSCIHQHWFELGEGMQSGGAEAAGLQNIRVLRHQCQTSAGQAPINLPGSKLHATW